MRFFLRERVQECANPAPNGGDPLPPEALGAPADSTEFHTAYERLISDANFGLFPFESRLAVAEAGAPVPRGIRYAQIPRHALTALIEARVGGVGAPASQPAHLIEAALKDFYSSMPYQLQNPEQAANTLEAAVAYIHDSLNPPKQTIRRIGFKLSFLQPYLNEKGASRLLHMTAEAPIEPTDRNTSPDSMPFTTKVIDDKPLEKPTRGFLMSSRLAERWHKHTTRDALSNALNRSNPLDAVEAAVALAGSDTQHDIVMAENNGMTPEGHVLLCLTVNPSDTLRLLPEPPETPARKVSSQLAVIAKTSKELVVQREPQHSPPRTQRLQKAFGSLGISKTLIALGNGPQRSSTEKKGLLRGRKPSAANIGSAALVIAGAYLVTRGVSHARKGAYRNA